MIASTPAGTSASDPTSTSQTVEDVVSVQETTARDQLSQLHLNGDDDEDALLQRALELSMMESIAASTNVSVAPVSNIATTTTTRSDDDVHMAVNEVSCHRYFICHKYILYIDIY